ncbi:MAG: 4-hydroxybenzoyl-CoA thioesterase [Bermanella sp.]|jgi:4-hydroxybenzoyl-CoA thioesterase
MALFSLPQRVYIEDTDAGGIVYYVNYLKYMERARTEFMRSLGYAKSTIFNADLMFVVAETQIKYLKPATLDDELAVSAAVLSVGGATMLFEQQVSRSDQLLCTATVHVACVDRHSLKPTRIPAEMLSQLRPTNGD